VVASSLEGLVLSYLWEWFVVPLGMKPVGILHAIGLCVLLDFVMYSYGDYRNSESASLSSSLAYILIRPTVAFLVGFVIKMLLPLG